MRIGPGDARHIGVRRRSQFDRIAAPVGIDDEIGDQPRIGWLYQDMRAARGPGAARRLADHPAHRIADRKSVVKGKSVTVRVDLGGRRIYSKNTIYDHYN